VDLITHPLAALLQSCDSPESITAVFREQIRALNEIPKKDKAMKPLRNVISRLSAISNSGAASQVRPDSVVGAKSPLTGCPMNVSDLRPIASPARRESIIHRLRHHTLFCGCLLLSLSAPLLDI
jgi:hypothetical protein